MSALPDKPSELLELAIGDVLEVEKMPGWELNMRGWIWRRWDGSCSACLAGAVMLRRLGVVPQEDHYPSPNDEPTRIGNKLHALNFLRKGDMDTAGYLLGVEIPTSICPHIPRHEDDRDGFFAALRHLVTDLREAGL